MIKAFILDVDGTLLDTNFLHVAGWRAAMDRFGYQVSDEKLAAHIGEGGDTYVPDVLGARANHRHGDELRKIHTDETLRLARETKVRIMHGALELVAELRRRKLRTVLATSSNREEFSVPQQSAGVDLTVLVDHVVTGNEARRSKPHPDLIHAALEWLELPPDQVLMVGDTVYDVLAARAARVAAIALRCGGTSPGARLGAAGARRVLADPRQVLVHLDELVA